MRKSQPFIPCEEFVTYGTSKKTPCQNRQKYFVRRPSDGDFKMVCGTHKNQLVRAGWIVGKVK